MVGGDSGDIEDDGFVLGSDDGRGRSEVTMAASRTTELVHGNTEGRGRSKVIGVASRTIESVFGNNVGRGRLEVM